MLKFLAILLAVVLAPLSARAEDYKSAFDRVMATRTLRCGYILYAPWQMRDVATGKLSGMTYDIVNQLGKDLSLKVEWVEETGTTSMFQGLETHRYDMICTPMWATGARARMAALTRPVFFSVINAYARTDDHRFDTSLAPANSPDVTLAGLDGSASTFIAASDFPRAKLNSLPELTDFSQMLLDVQTGKADLTFAEVALFLEFDRNNPGALRNVTLEHPVRLSAFAFAVQADERRLVATLDTALDELHNSGFIEKTMARYEPAPNTWRRVARSYQ